MQVHDNDPVNYSKATWRSTFSGLAVSEEPRCYPVTLKDVKRALRLTDTSQDDQIESMIAAATHFAEAATGWCLIPRTLIQYLDYFPQTDIDVIAQPLRSVSSITYLDTDGDQQTLASSQYVVDTNSRPPRITRAYSVVWPTERRQAGSIAITFRAGYPEATGAIQGAITAGAQTSIIADGFDVAPKRNGVLYMENTAGDYEIVNYTKYASAAGVYTFVVDDTLTYSYEDDSTIIAYNIPDSYRRGIIAAAVMMFEHPEMESEVMLYRNRTLMNLLKVDTAKGWA